LILVEFFSDCSGTKNLPFDNKTSEKKGKCVASKLDLSLFHKGKFVGNVAGLHLKMSILRTFHVANFIYLIIIHKNQH
jgi:hypothetical protein